jgi:hypothetical protein
MSKKFPALQSALINSIKSGLEGAGKFSAQAGGKKFLLQGGESIIDL